MSLVRFSVNGVLNYWFALRLYGEGSGILAAIRANPNLQCGVGPLVMVWAVHDYFFLSGAPLIILFCQLPEATINSLLGYPLGCGLNWFSSHQAAHHDGQLNPNCEESCGLYLLE
jgi:hypothetical protein